MKQKIYIIDWHNFIYRLFYAIPQFSLKDWTPINTVFWLAKMILGWQSEDKPDKLFFVLDSKWDNYRHQIYTEYKGTREKMPSDLKVQEPLIMELLEAFEIDTISMQWYEADDIIWTLVEKLRKNSENDIYILSWDKDLYQFVDGNVAVYDTMKRRIAHSKEVIEKFWVEAKFVVDYLAICWDSSDNIPGIPWFWPKKAQELINKYWSLEQIYENLENITGKTKDVLIEQKEVAFLSKKLASIDTQVDLWNLEIEDYFFRDKKILNDKSIALFKKFEFKSLIPTTHQDQIKNFPTLGLKMIKISEYSKLDELIEKIQKSRKVAISTIWNSVFELDEISLYLWEKIAYTINIWDIEIHDFLKKLLNLDIEIIWFELKEDLKRIYWYLENRWIKLKILPNSNQWSLF